MRKTGDRTCHYHGLMASTSEESRLELVASAVSVDFESGPAMRSKETSGDASKVLRVVLKQVGILEYLISTDHFIVIC